MIIERPNLNKADPMANIAMIDTWIARTADALNYEWQQLQKELAALAEEKESTEQTSSEIPADAVTRAEFVAALANKADAAALANKAIILPSLCFLFCLPIWAMTRSVLSSRKCSGIL